MNRSLWRAGLMAGLIVALVGSSARAGFVFQINNLSTGDGFRITELSNGSFTVVAPPGGTLVGPTTFTANDSVIKGTATIDGVDFKFRAFSNEDTANPNPAVVQANITESNHSGSTQGFGFFVADSPFPPPAPGQMFLQARTHSFEDYTPGTVTFSNANIGGVAHTGQTPPVTGPNQTTVSNTVPVNLNSQYALTNVGGNIHLLDGASSHFITTASLAMPEPTGVLLGLLGLPCMGGLVGWVRRRRAAAAA
jgi:hypothetical protein